MGYCNVNLKTIIEVNKLPLMDIFVSWSLLRKPLKINKVNNMVTQNLELSSLNKLVNQPISVFFIAVNDVIVAQLIASISA